jgi:hypothetical protein
MAKYQQLKKDLEPQDTAGLDIALADTVHTLSQQTQLGAAQVGVLRLLVTLAQPQLACRWQQNSRPSPQQQ